MDRAGTTARVRLGAVEGDVPAEPRRSRRAAVLAAVGRTPHPAGGGAAVVHDDVRTRQHLHQPAGAAVHAGAGGDHAARAGLAAGHAHRRLPRGGARANPARDALRRDDRVRGATSLAVLRLRRRDAVVRRPARPLRALERRHQARPRARVRGARGAQLDRRVRRPAGQRLRLVSAAQRGDRAREPVLEGLAGLDLVPRRHAARVPASDVRAAGLRLRRQGPRRPAGPRGVARRPATRPSSSARRPTSSAGSTATSGSPTTSTSRSRSTPTVVRSTRSHRTSAICCGAASSTSRRRRRSCVTSWATACSRDGGCARWPRARAATTRSATTSARCGRSTTPSSPGVCAATASRTRRRGSPPASSTPPSSSRVGSPRRSAATRVR